MTGRANDSLEAEVAVELSNDAGQSISVAAIVDTGFTGALSISGRIADQLDWPVTEAVPIELADGSRRLILAYEGLVLWEGRRRAILALQTDGPVLLGMGLMLNERIVIDVRPGGPVEITSLAD